MDASMGSVPEKKEVREVALSLEREDVALNSLASEIDKLSVRIKDVLNPTEPCENEVTSDKSLVRNTKCDLSIEIDGRVNRIIALYRQIQDLCDRVQL